MVLNCCYTDGFYRQTVKIPTARLYSCILQELAATIRDFKQKKILPMEMQDMRMKIISGLALLLSITQANHANELSTLEERMSQTEFHSAGLDKLSPQELETLNTWLRSHNAISTPADRVGLSTPESREVVNSRIAGSFSGWSGKTVFKLENGQWWKQGENDSFSAPEQQNPEISITPGLLGGWMLKVKGYNRSVHVERIH